MKARTVPVSRDDRVSDVLARDESLVETFIRYAPQFEKLRNRTMRRVMARLVTVEQAARMANVPPERLIDALNRALRIPSAATTDVERSIDAGAEASEHHPEHAAVVELDVRDDLRSGREPFSRIMGAVATVGSDEVLHLRSIFEPVPLFTALGKRGFVHESMERASGDWSVWFWRPTTTQRAVEAPPPAGGDAGDVPDDDHRTIHLDVRGCSPPEPMLRTLAALESIAPGQTLVQINSRVPLFLLPMLAERGFAWEIDESRPDRVLVRIAHAS